MCPLSRQTPHDKFRWHRKPRENLWFQLKVSPFPFICGTNKQPAATQFSIGVTHYRGAWPSWWPQRNKVMSFCPQPAPFPTLLVWTMTRKLRVTKRPKNLLLFQRLGNGKSFSHPFCNKIIIYFIFVRLNAISREAKESFQVVLSVSAAQ